MTRHINHGDQSWSNTKDIKRTDRRPAMTTPVETKFQKGFLTPRPRTESLSGGRTVTWPAHVQVQVIPGIERTEGLPANLYVDPAQFPARLPGSFLAEFDARRQHRSAAVCDEDKGAVCAAADGGAE